MFIHGTVLAFTPKSDRPFPVFLGFIVTQLVAMIDEGPIYDAVSPRKLGHESN